MLLYTTYYYTLYCLHAIACLEYYYILYVRFKRFFLWNPINCKPCFHAVDPPRALQAATHAVPVELMLCKCYAYALPWLFAICAVCRCINIS